MAFQTGVQLIDLRRIFIDHLRQHNPTHRDRGVLTTDGVHLNETGNRFVGHHMFRELGMSAAARNAPPRMLRHLVLFKFKDGLPESDIQGVVDQFGQLPGKIDAIADFESGVDISTENLAQGYTHCFLVSFRDEAGRDAYLPHAAHQEFVKFLDGKIDQVLVVDYWSR